MAWTTRSRRGLVLGLIAAVVSPAAARAMPMTPEGSLNLPAVDCWIDGNPWRCVIDTGSDFTISLPESPRTAGLPLIAARHSMGASGVLVPVDQVKLGKISVGNMTVTQPADAVREPSPHAYAVLGRGFFQTTRTVTFDFRAMTVTPDGPAGPGCRDTFHVAAMMEVPAEFDGKPIQVGWDTGAGITAVDEALVARRPELFHYVKDMPGTDATERNVAAKIYTTSALSLCGAKLEDMPVAAVDLKAARAKRPDMPDVIIGDNLIGGHVWSFDFSDGRWSVN